MSNRYHSKYAPAVNRMLECNELRVILGLKTTDWINIGGDLFHRIENAAKRFPVTLQYGDEKSVKVNYPNPLYLREALKQIRGGNK